MTSTVLNKSFLNEILNKPAEIFYKDYNKFSKYLKTDVVYLLKAKLLVHRITGTGDEQEVILIYKYENKYILLEIFEGTCELCYNNIDNYNTLIDNAIEKCYVTTSFDDVMKYYYNKVVIHNNEDFVFDNIAFTNYYDLINYYRKLFIE